MRWSRHQEWREPHTMLYGLLMLSLLLGLMAALVGCSDDLDVDSDHGCPPKQQIKVGSCRDKIQRYMTTYYEYSSVKKRCVKKFRAKENSCMNDGNGKAEKNSHKSCPKRRFLEPGPCKNGKHKVLVEHYEFSEKHGRCIVHQDYVIKKCPQNTSNKHKKSTTPKESHGCPEPQVSQSSCRPSGYRTVTTVYSVFVKDLGRCVKKVKQEDEKCALLVKNTSCPADQTQEVGPCKDGYRTNIVYAYERDLEGRCARKSKKITVTCSGKKADECPPKRVKKVGACKERIQRWLTIYYEFSKLKGRCVKKFRAREKPCGFKAGGSSTVRSKKCPKRRVLEPGPCKNGMHKVLVEHYEFSEKLGRCTVHKDYEIKKCRSHVPDSGKKASKVKVNDDCPEAQVSQSSCRPSGYRTITTVYFVVVKGLKRCVRKVMQEDEKCAKLLKNVSCPGDATVETGPCGGDGYRTNIVYRYRRSADGSCMRERKSITETCRAKNRGCPPRLRKKLSPCREGIERWLTTYHVYSKLKKRCIRKLIFKEISCSKNKKSCPTPRIVEPGPCKRGRLRLLIEHFEYSAKAGKCVSQKNYVNKKCGSAKKIKDRAGPSGKPGKKGEAKYSCPDPEFHQQPCKGKYRTVVKIYRDWSPVKGRCVKRVKLATEACAALVKTGCPEDELVESGPCRKSGYRSNIVFRHLRDSKGNCKAVEVHVTETCAKPETRKCEPSTRKRLQPCSKSGIERWLTTYYVFNKSTKRCVRKLRYKEVSCKRSKNCPRPRILEPSACRKGRQRVLIEHYEWDAKQGKCRLKRDYVHRSCGKLSKRKAEAKKHACPDSEYHQKPCNPDGYRNVVKLYYRYNTAKGHCVRNVKVDEEKCSRLVGTRSSCKPDETVEEGPCKDGYRQDIVYRYERNKADSCVRREVHVTVTCVARRVVP